MPHDIEWEMPDGTFVTVTYDYTPGHGPIIDYVNGGEPGEGPEIEFLSVMDEEGNEVSLPSGIEESIRDHIAANQDDWDEGDEGDRAYDEWRDEHGS